MGLLHSQQHQSTGENLTGKTRLQEISAHGHLARKTPLTDSWTAEKEIPPQHLLQIPERTPPHWDKAQSLNRWPPKKKHPTYLWTLDIPMTSSMTSNLELQTFPSASFQHWPVQELLYCLYNCQTWATSVMTKWEPPHPRLQMTDHHPKHRLNFNSQVHIPFPLHLHLKLGPAT